MVKLKKKNRSKEKKKDWCVYDALFITGGSVHYGNEENLPKTESKRSMCQGPRSVYFSDVRLLPVHRSRLRVVSSRLGSHTLFTSLNQMLNALSVSRGKRVWSKAKAQGEEHFKDYEIKFTAFSCILMDFTFFKTQPNHIFFIYFLGMFAF